MNRVLKDEIVRLGGDPSDDVWFWLAARGPHGPSFTWAQARSEPPGYVGAEHLARVVIELGHNISEFQPRIRNVLDLALSSNIPELLCRAIQVAAVVGMGEQLPRIKELQGFAEPAVASDARAASFYLKGRS